MIYLENDFFSNFNSISKSNDSVALNNLFIDQISSIIAYKKDDLLNLFKKIDLKITDNPSNKDLSNAITKNIKNNKKLQIGLAYLIAEKNNILQQEMKKSRANDYSESFEGFKKNIDKKNKQPKKPVDWNKTADAVSSIGNAVSVFADSITQAKTGVLATDLENQSNTKNPSNKENEEEQQLENVSSTDNKENNQISQAKIKKRNRNIMIAVVLVLGITAYIGYKKGWFLKNTIN